MVVYGKLGKSKKGSMMDVLYIALILIFFGIVLLISSKVSGEFNDQIQGMATANMPTEAKVAASAVNSNYSGTFDNVFLFLTVGLAIAALVLAALVRVHPIFIPFFFIIWIIIVFLCGVLSNIYQTMAENANLAAEASSMTFIYHILTYLPLIVGVIGIMMMVVLYKIYQVDG